MRSNTNLNEAPRRRGRPPAYQRETALAALTATFWNKGFAATSLDDLAAATGMKRPSLYAGFGDKQAMYLAVLDQYRRDAEAQLGAVLASVADTAAAVRAMLRAGVDFYTEGGSGTRGCLAVCTAAAESMGNADTRAALAATLATLDAVIAARLARGVADGDLPAGFDCAGRAALIAAMLHSIAVRARAGADRAELLALADAAGGLLLR